MFALVFSRVQLYRTALNNSNECTSIAEAMQRKTDKIFYNERRETERDGM